MKKLTNFIPFLSALVWLGAYLWLRDDPKNFLWVDLAMVIFCLLASWRISAKSKEKHWWNSAWLPMTTNLIALGYLVIISNQFLIDVMVIALIILNYVYWRFVYFYYNAPNRYTSFSLDNLSFYVNFLNVFLLGALAFGLRAFLQYNFWLILIGVSLTLALILYQGMWVSKVDWKKYGWYWSINLLILLEFFGVLGLLPLNHNLLGFLWASIYYLLLILFNDLMNHHFSHKRLWLYLSVVGGGWLILLLTASWL